MGKVSVWLMCAVVFFYSRSAVGRVFVFISSVVLKIVYM